MPSLTFSVVACNTVILTYNEARIALFTKLSLKEVCKIQVALLQTIAFAFRSPSKTWLEPVDLIDTSICHCCHSFNAIGKLSLDAMMAEMTVREWSCHMERGQFLHIFFVNGTVQYSTQERKDKLILANWHWATCNSYNICGPAESRTGEKHNCKMTVYPSIVFKNICRCFLRATQRVGHTKTDLWAKAQATFAQKLM